MNTAMRWTLLLFFFFFTGMAFAQNDFSADLVDTSNGKANTKTKIYATKDKMRFEPQAEGPQRTAVILDLTSHTAHALMPQNKMYVDAPQDRTPGAPRWSRELFRPSDPGNACTEWLKLPANQGGSCKSLGSETVNGRSTIKYEGTNAKGDTGYAWIDKKIGFPVKWQENGQSWELQNIQEGSQPSKLFEVPADYQKFQMPAGMQNMQRPQ
jgi:Domain of unknown function (DUF4412)